MAIINQYGLGDAGCPITPQGDCVLNGMPVSCSLIRECDNQTGNLHYEYTLPGGKTGNVNINVADTSGNLIGYNDRAGNFVDTADVSIASLTAGVQKNRSATQRAINAIEEAKSQAYKQASQVPGASALSISIAMAQAAAKAAREFSVANPVTQTQAGTVTGAIVNTPQTVTSQQGNPAHSTTTNNNQATNGGGNNSVNTGTGNNGTLQTFSNLLSQGTGWLEGKTWGIDNKWLALGGAVAIAVGGGYVGGARRGR